MRISHAYDLIGRGYASGRRPDPRWAAIIMTAIGSATRIVNLGAGSGSYEPSDRTVIAVEPSRTMLAQRQARSAPAVQAVAEHVPLASGSAQAAMAILSVHHWSNWRLGLAEMCRLAPRRVILTFDPAVHAQFWLVRDYVPQVASHIHQAPLVEQIAEELGSIVQIATMGVPWDCTDGFLSAYWRRPNAYLDPKVRAWSSGLAQSDPDAVRRGVAHLEHDIRTGVWNERYAHIIPLDSMDTGFRLIISQA